MRPLLPLATLALCALPTLAQSHQVGLLVTQLTSRTFNSGDQYSTGKTTGFALRYGQDIVTLRPLAGARLTFEGTWMPRTGGKDLKVNGEVIADPGASIKYRHEYMSLGLSLNWTMGADFGGGLELRHEGNALYISEPNQPSYEFSGDYTRPWMTLRGGYTFPLPKAKPFVSLEMGIPLAKKVGNKDLVELSLARGLNPKFQVSLVGGLKF